MIRRWRALPPRRGEFFPVVPSAAPLPPFLATRRRVATMVRRGEFSFVPPLPVAPPPPPPPAFLTTRRRVVTVARRGEFTFALPPPAPPPPPFVHRRTPVVWIRRGSYFPVPLQAPQPPPRVARAFTRLGPVRRGSYLYVPPTVVPVVPHPFPVWLNRPARRPSLPLRRGQFFPWTYSPPRVILPTPPGRIYLVQANPQGYAVPSNGQLYLVPANPQTYVVSGDDTSVGIQVFIKESGETFDYTFDWTAGLLPGDTIIASSWAITPAGSLIQSPTQLPTFTTKTTTIWLTAGTNGNNYSLLNTVITAGGRTYDRLVTISCIFH